MIVKFLQSDGFAGLMKGVDLDTLKLPEKEAQELEGLVRDSGITAATESLSKSARDLQEYQITIDTSGSPLTAVFDDETLPKNARALVGFLKKRSGPKKL